MHKFKVPPEDFPGDPVAKPPNSQCRGPSLIPSQGTTSHMPQLKILHATTMIWHSQIKIKDSMNFRMVFFVSVKKSRF